MTEYIGGRKGNETVIQMSKGALPYAVVEVPQEVIKKLNLKDGDKIKWDQAVYRVSRCTYLPLEGVAISKTGENLYDEKNSPQSEELRPKELRQQEPSKWPNLDSPVKVDKKKLHAISNQKHLNKVYDPKTGSLAFDSDESYSIALSKTSSQSGSW